jgi:hypothetical protein
MTTKAACHRRRPRTAISRRRGVGACLTSRRLGAAAVRCLPLWHRRLLAAAPLCLQRRRHSHPTSASRQPSCKGMLVATMLLAPMQQRLQDSLTRRLLLLRSLQPPLLLLLLLPHLLRQPLPRLPPSQLARHHRPCLAPLPLLEPPAPALAAAETSAALLPPCPS